MYNQDYDGQQDPYDAPYPTTQPTAPVTPPPTQVGPNGGNATLLGYDGQTEVYRGSDGQKYVLGPTGANGFATWSPYTGKATSFSPSPGKGDPIDPTAPPPPTSPAPAPAPAPAPTGGAIAPAPTPSVTPAQPTPPPAFHYDDFAAPDPNDLSNDKAFQFENAEGLRAIGARNAALGTLNTGGTLKDYVTFGQNLAHTRYGDLYDRSLRTYDTNRANAVGTYNENYGTQYKDPWDQSMQRASLDQNTNQFNSSQGFNTWLEAYKRSTLDPFDQKYKTLSLL